VQQNVEPNECMDDLMNISHIRKVIVRQSKKGIHERIERLPTGYC
jgi:hypothetical protein